ncbi:hypothetical protein HPB47_021282 [Ixodes persulcatus]|uniref:Uncharacterized protein n=1 Tax=Ixodes persulcatus TaxID=34615 RepID=A0AC60QCZ9_IXOPE|nr:hypothetical protein HPB47_021282 [Ixodes persulcatus]
MPEGRPRHLRTTTITTPPRAEGAKPRREGKHSPGVEVSAAWCSTAPTTRASPGPGAAALVTGTLPGRAPLSGQVRTVGRHSPGAAIQRQHSHRRRFPESLHRHPQSETCAEGTNSVEPSCWPCRRSAGAPTDAT